MSITPLTSEPASIYAGDTISWNIALPDYPASGGWTLKYKALCADGYFALTSTADGDDHAVSAAKATTAAFIPGTYNLVKYVESTTELVTLSESTFTVNPALSGKTDVFDNRTINKRILDAIDAVLEGRASSSDLKTETTIDGTTRRLEKIPHTDLLKLRGVYGYKVYRETNHGKLAPSVRVSFGGIY